MAMKKKIRVLVIETFLKVITSPMFVIFSKLHTSQKLYFLCIAIKYSFPPYESEHEF